MMAALSLSDVAAVSGGELQGEARFERVSTDTRTLQPGDLYVALSGEQFDGNRFVEAAAAKGACAAVVNRGVDTDLPAVKVDDTRLALGMIARSNRRQFSGPLIALTGSAGKTSTKELVASILAVAGRVLATRGNLNNEIGVPLTLLELKAEHHYAVIEMGASQQGDIAYLCRFAEPTIAVLTNALPAHIAGFGDIETIARTKGEIFECLDGSGVAIANFDDRFYTQWQQQAQAGTVISFSKLNEAADYYASDIGTDIDGSCRFQLHCAAGSVPVHLPLLGEHNIVNALAAAAAAMAAGVGLAQVQQGLQQAAAVKGRLTTYRGAGFTLIDDSYNASPGSVTAAIDVLAEFAGPRCLVLGTMAELGNQAEQRHQEVASYARQKGIEQLVAVGEYAPQMVASFGGNGKAYQRMEVLLAELEVLAAAAVVLVKGSRSARMERLVDALRQADNEGNS